MKYILGILIIIIVALIYFPYQTHNEFELQKKKKDSIQNQLIKREQIIDSLNSKIINLQDTLQAIEVKIDSQRTVIKKIQNEKRKKVVSIDTLTTSELQGYFSENYPR